MQITSDNIHGFGSFPGKPWSFKSKFTGDLEPTPLSNQGLALRGALYGAPSSSATRQEEKGNIFQKPAYLQSEERRGGSSMVKFLLWCILLVLCWPLALLALVLYPIVWVLLLPFRILGIAVEGVLDLLRALITLPGRLLGAPRRA
jgi:hypothetical protein